MKTLLITLTVVIFLFPGLAFGDAPEGKGANQATILTLKDCMAKYSDSEMCNEIAILDGEIKLAKSGKRITEMNVDAPTPTK
jgi:hypothetical protein